MLNLVSKLPQISIQIDANDSNITLESSVQPLLHSYSISGSLKSLCVIFKGYTLYDEELNSIFHIQNDGVNLTQMKYSVKEPESKKVLIVCIILSVLSFCLFGATVILIYCTPSFFQYPII